MIEIKPWEFQEEAIDSIFHYFQKKNGNPIVVMPTGTGKSIVLAGFCKKVFNYYPKQKFLVVTHVKELIEQNYDKLLTMWPSAPAGIYSAGLNKRDIHNSIIFAGIGSVAKRAHEFGHVDLMFVDEAHTVSPNQSTMYQTFIAGLMEVNSSLKVVGLTATPWRLGHGKITEDGLFTDICFDISGVEAFNRLIAEGYLSTLIPKRTQNELDVDGVHMRGGDFIQKELQNAVDKDEITYAALREALEKCGNRKKWLIFTAGIDHSIHAADILTELGVPCRAIHSKLSKTERKEILHQHRTGIITAISNNNVLTTGYDDPEIDLIIVLRPTESAVLWVQMLGRGTRPNFAPGFDLSNITGRLAAIEAGGKENCLVLDFAGNSKRIGPINDPVKPRRKGASKGDAPIKVCPQCDVYNHAGVRFCMSCNYEFVFETKLKQAASSAELIKGDLPITEIFKVDHITFNKHIKQGSGTSMQIGYHCNLKLFKEYIPIEYQPNMRRRGERWWNERSEMELPDTVEKAIEKANELRVVTHLRVWINKKYPEIMAYCYDGSAFGKEEASDVRPTIGNVKAKEQPQKNDFDDFDQDGDVF